MKKRIDTERLFLRKPQPSDAPDIYDKWTTSTKVTHFLSWKPHESKEQTQGFIQWCINQWNEETEIYPYMICNRVNDEIVGMIEIRINGSKSEFGYVLEEKSWNKGYMTETLKRVIEELFLLDSIYRIWSFCDTENLPSLRVMEKAGMKREGILKKWELLPNISHVPRDCFVCSVVRPD